MTGHRQCTPLLIQRDLSPLPVGHIRQFFFPLLLRLQPDLCPVFRPWIVFQLGQRDRIYLHPRWLHRTYNMVYGQPRLRKEAENRLSLADHLVRAGGRSSRGPGWMVSRPASQFRVIENYMALDAEVQQAWLVIHRYRRR